MPSWSHLLTDTITYSLRSGVDAHGSPSFAAQTTTTGRFEKDAEMQRVQSGQWVSADKLATSVEMPIGTRVWPPGYATGDDNAALEVKRCVSAASPLTGDTLYEVIL